MLNLKEKEQVCINALEETCIKYEMDEYSIGTPIEQKVCILKKDDNWEVFIVERGVEIDKTKHKECIDACLEVLKLCSYCRDEFNDSSNEFKNILLKHKIKVIKKV